MYLIQMRMKHKQSMRNLGILPTNKKVYNKKVYKVRHTRLYCDHILRSRKVISAKWHILLWGNIDQPIACTKRSQGAQSKPCSLKSKRQNRRYSTTQNFKNVHSSFRQCHCCWAWHSGQTVRSSQYRMCESVDLLQKLYQNDEAYFKSPELRAAVETALSSAYDVLTILPTGGWKSLLFFLYAKKYPHMTSIVVVPERNFCAKNINNTAALNQKPLQNSHHKAPLSVFQPVNQ